MAIESRAGMRVKIDATIMVEIEMGMKEKVRILREPLKAVIIDIGVVGIGIIAPLFFPKGAILIIEMDASIFGMRKQERLVGEVRYCHPASESKYRIGIKFLEIDKLLLVKIKEYIEQNKQKGT